MAHYRLRSSAPFRSATEVGPGDFVKAGHGWQEIKSNSAFGSPSTPKSWEVTTKDGVQYGMWSVKRYAKAEDIEREQTGF